MITCLFFFVCGLDYIQQTTKIGRYFDIKISRWLFFFFTRSTFFSLFKIVMEKITESLANLTLDLDKYQKRSITSLLNGLNDDEYYLIFKRDKKDYLLVKNQLYYKNKEGGWEQSEEPLEEHLKFLKLAQSTTSSKEDNNKRKTYSTQEDMRDKIYTCIFNEKINSVNHFITLRYFF